MRGCSSAELKDSGRSLARIVDKVSWLPYGRLVPAERYDLATMTTSKRKHHGSTRHALHRPVGRPDLGSDLSEGQAVGLRRHRVALLGRPLQRATGAEGGRILQGAA